MTIHHKSAYCTLDRIVQQLELVDEAAFSTTTQANTRIDAQSTNVRNQLKDFIYEVSDDLYNLKFRDFVPRVETLTIKRQSREWAQGWCYDYGTWFFRLEHIRNMDLLEIDSITLDGTAINSSYYELDLSFGYPATAIRFDADNITFPTTSTFSTSLEIVGTWGYHENPAAMWVDSGDTVQNATSINATSTSLSVTAGTNFETYQYIKIEDEILFIESISTNTLTVIRGVNGSTAAIHSNGTAISTYNQTPSVSKDVARMVIREFALRNGLNIVLLAETVADVNVGQFLLKIPERWTVTSL